MSRSLFASMSALFLLSGTPAVAEPPAAASSGYVLPETETWELKGGDGYPYQIFVSKPAGSAPEGGYPVLIVLDGNAGVEEAARAGGVHAPAELEGGGEAGRGLEGELGALFIEAHADEVVLV